MNPPSNPQFCSEQLQSAVDAAKEVFENLEESRTRVSNDIKKLEAYLVQQGLKEPFRFGLGKAFEFRDGERCDLQDCGSASGFINEEAIVWSAHEGERFRLLYEFSKWEGGVDIDGGGDPYYWNEDTLARESKPLIETKFDIRKRVYASLADFIDALRKHLTVKTPNMPPEFDGTGVPF